MNYFESVFAVREEILNCVQISDDEAVNEETGEIIDVAALEALKMEFSEKVYNIGMWLKNKRVEAEALKAEKMKLAKRQASAERDIEMLTNVLDGLMQGGTFKDPSKPLLTISYRKSKKVIVDDITQVPEMYLKVVEPEANRKLIGEAIKNGEVVAGAHQEECSNIQIK